MTPRRTALSLPKCFRWDYKPALSQNQCGVRIMKTDIKEIKLQIWEEVIGDCVKFEVKKDRVAVILRACQNMQIAYPRGSEEGIILGRFGRKLIGQKLEILRTDIPAKPIVVRVMPNKDSACSVRRDNPCYYVFNIILTLISAHQFLSCGFSSSSQFFHLSQRSRGNGSDKGLDWAYGDESLDCFLKPRLSLRHSCVLDHFDALHKYEEWLHEMQASEKCFGNTVGSRVDVLTLHFEIRSRVSVLTWQALKTDGFASLRVSVSRDPYPKGFRTVFPLAHKTGRLRIQTIVLYLDFSLFLLFSHLRCPLYVLERLFSNFSALPKNLQSAHSLGKPLLWFPTVFQSNSR